MAILTNAASRSARAGRPVRWRRQLRSACVWAAAALGTAAVANELLASGALAVAIPPALLALRDLALALRARRSGKLAERLGRSLGDALGDAYVVLTEYEPRDRGDIVPLVVAGPAGVFVIEPRDEDATFACYGDGWHTVDAHGIVHLATSPSKRARENAARVRGDISGGGHIRTTVAPLVLLERGRGDHCASSTVPVVCGVEALATELLGRAPKVRAAAQHTRAVADALLHPLLVSASG